MKDSGVSFDKVEGFKYLISVVYENGGIAEDVVSMISRS